MSQVDDLIQALFGARQMAGGGVVGQGLQTRANQLNQAGMTPQQIQNNTPGGTQGLLGGPQMPPAGPAPPPPTGIRPGYQNLDPSDWSPEETADFNGKHGIKSHTKVDTLKGILGIQ